MPKGQKNITNDDKFDTMLLDDLKDPKYAALFLNNAIEEYLEDGDIKSFNAILSYIVKAQNVSQIAKDTNISRTHLYRIINSKSEPTLTNAIKILKALGYILKVESIEKTA